MAFVIPTIFKAVDQMSVVMGKISRGLVGMNNIAGTSGAALTHSLNTISSNAMEIATSAGAIGLAIAVPLGLATKAAVDFEKQMTNVATLMDTTRESVQQFSDGVLDLASKTPVPIHDLTEALYQLRSEGFKGSEAMGLLGQSAKLSVAGLSTASEAAKSMATAMRLFGRDGISAEEIANVFFKTVATGRTTMSKINEAFGENALVVASAGVKFQEFQAATAAMTNAGATAAGAQTDIAQATLALIKPTETMIKIFRVMGLSGSEAGRQLIEKKGGLVPAMEAIAMTANKTGESIEKAFGRKQGLVAFDALTKTVKGQFTDTLREMTNGADMISAAYAKQLGTTAAQTEIAKNNITILAIRIGELLLPALTSLVQTVTPVVQWLTRFAENHKLITGAIVKGMAAFAGFALTVSAIGFAVSTVTKAVWLWNIALKSIGFIQGFVAVRMGTLTGSILEQTGATAGATFALGGYMAAIAKTVFWLGLAYTSMKALNEQMEKNDKFRKINPLNFNFADPAGAKSPYNKKIMETYGITPDMFNKWRASYNQKNLNIQNPDGGPIGNAIVGFYNKYKTPSFPTTQNADSLKRYTDSMRNSTNDLYEHLNDYGGDTVKVGRQKSDTSVVINMSVDKNGNVGVSSTGGIPVKINQTGSY